MLAETHLRLGQIEAGLVVVAETKELMARNEDRMWEAELHRIEGELLRAGGASAEAEACFLRARAVARGQGARSLELRAATSLARLWRDRGERSEARGLLAPVRGWFTEGQGTPDLEDADLLLPELGGASPRVTAAGRRPRPASAAPRSADRPAG